MSDAPGTKESGSGLVTQRIHRHFKIGRLRVRWTRLKHKGHLPTRHVWTFNFVYDEPWCR